ncbi:DUF3800 domain-containing protein [Paracoccus lutimaris]|nr:DUF3800 domain-containing protein [Paracoccus lutimaris]
MAHSFNVYIDESGDDGMAKFRGAGDGGGASNWLAVGACVVRSSRDLELVALRDRIRQECRPRSSKREIHFKDFNHNQKRRACQIIAGQPLRFSCVLGLKNTPNAGTFVQKNQLYFYLTRYLIERVSWLCRDKRPSVPEGNGTAKIVFSRRGGLSYDGFRSYLELLKDRHETQIHWPVIDIASVDAQDHSRVAALQIADCGVSAIAAAMEPDLYGNVEASYLHELAGNIYNRRGNFASYGLKTLPPLDQANLSQQQAESFQRFR